MTVGVTRMVGSLCKKMCYDLIVEIALYEKGKLFERVGRKAARD